MKAISLMLRSIVPPELWDDGRVWDKAGTDKLLAEVAGKYPERYATVAKDLSDVGREAAWRAGITLTLQDMKPSPAVNRAATYQAMDEELAAAKKMAKTPEEYHKVRGAIWERYSAKLEADVMAAARKHGGNLANTVISGARGNSLQLKAMQEGPSLYQDQNDRTVPLFIRNSYGEGLRPAEYLASTFGVRKSVVATKTDTAKGGDFCLHEDTEVRMADGSARRLRDIKPGDLVLGAAISGGVTPTRVVRVFDQGRQPVFLWQFWRRQAGRSITLEVCCTAEHKFLHELPGITELRLVSAISTFNAFTHVLITPRPDSEWLPEDSYDFVRRETCLPVGEQPCLDLEVEHPDHLFVLANGLICSNSKILGQAAADLVVTDHDCGTANGMTYDTEQPDALGRVLLHDAGSLKAGDVLDKTALITLRREKVPRVQARSPMTCQMEEGICAKCLGRQPNGHFAPKGYHAGLTASTALGEPVTQGALNTKHTGGLVSGKKEFSGFDVLSQLVQSPETFPNRATVAEKAGRVEQVEKAPQGGHYVRVGGQEHYVLPGFEVTAKPGEEVEAGDTLSEGIVDSADIVRLRGLGEGRKYLVNRLDQVYRESKYGKPHRTNLELAARAMLNHVNIQDPDGFQGYLPDDTVNYQALAANYVPPKEARLVPVRSAVGHYLQAPYQHHTVGTQLTPRMTRELAELGHDQVLTTTTAPAFAPETIRLRTASHNTQDWLARMNSSYLMSGLEQSAIRAQDTNTESNVHFGPRLAVGKDFAKDIETTGKF